VAGSGEERKSQDILRIVCEPRGDGVFDEVFGGINFFGNALITMRFFPFDLRRVRAISFDFRYPESQKGSFFIKFKNDENFETREIPIAAEGDREIFKRFTLDPSSYKEITTILATHSSFPIMNISIATDFGRYPWNGKAIIELRDFKIEMR
jgi:hypothetical protein